MCMRERRGLAQQRSTLTQERNRQVWGGVGPETHEGICRFLAARVAAWPSPSSCGPPARDSAGEDGGGGEHRGEAAVSSEERMVSAVAISLALALAGDAGGGAVAGDAGSSVLVRSGLVRLPAPKKTETALFQLERILVLTI